MRLSLDEYFLRLAIVVSYRSTCARARHGAVLVRASQIISTGYNGAPSGFLHCTKDSCRRKGEVPGQGYDRCISVHAEANAIIQAAKHGISTDGAILYVTGLPCNQCARLIANAGIKEVRSIRDSRYNFRELSYSFLRDAGVTITEIAFPDYPWERENLGNKRVEEE